MHVDGGVTSQVFLYPVGIDWRLVEQRLKIQGRPKVYLIRNAFLDTDWQTIERKIAPIVGRTVSSMISTQGIGDLYRMYLESVRDGLDFHLAYIPDDVEYTAKKSYDPVYMRTLYERGRSMAEGEYPWTTVPPDLGLSAVEAVN